MAAADSKDDLRPIVARLTSYQDVVGGFRNQALAAMPKYDPFVGGHVRQIHGRGHLLRRRAMSKLLSRDGDRRFREEGLFPSVEKHIRDMQAARDEDGFARIDLVKFAYRMFLNQGVRIAGFREMSEADVDHLDRLMGKIRQGRMAVSGDKGTDVLEVMSEEFDEAELRGMVAAGLEAMAEIKERYFLPALTKREQVVTDIEAGTVDEASLPRDLLTLIALNSDPEWGDRDLALREILSAALSASVSTSTDLLAHVCNEIFLWLWAHPDQGGRCTSPDFITRSINESLRLHPANAGFIRTALEDVTLPNGVAVSAGDRVILHIGEANQDEAVFGASAREFDPDRQLPAGVLPFGTAFGAGPHMCWGMPLVIGNEEAEGMHQHVLKKLFEAGMEPDPERPPELMPRMLLARFRSYPVRFPAA